MKRVYDYFNNDFLRSYDRVGQAVWLNISFFLLLLVVKVFSVLIGSASYYDVVCNYLYLSPSFQSLLYKPWSVVTCFLVHKGVFNVFSTSLMINALGRYVCYFLSSRSFVYLYFGGGVFGSFLFLLANNYLPALRHSDIALYGSMAAVYALMSGLCAFVPDFSFRLFLLGSIRLKYVTAFMLFFKLVELSNGRLEGIASIGGMMFGYLYILIFKRWLGGGNGIYNFFKRKKSSSAFITVHDIDSDKVHSIGGKASQDEIDKILDKIASSGYNSLTLDEKRKLLESTKK